MWGRKPAPQGSETLDDDEEEGGVVGEGARPAAVVSVEAAIDGFYAINLAR